MKTIFPEIITSLPVADIPFKGIKGWLLQGVEQQLVFMDIEPIGKVAEHSHAAQWGIVVDGEMKLTIDGNTRVFKKGDSYFIPEGIIHSAEFLKRTLILDFFNEKSRYLIKDL